jgi:hypothetical protein
MFQIGPRDQISTSVVSGTFPLEVAARLAGVAYKLPRYEVLHIFSVCLRDYLGVASSSAVYGKSPNVTDKLHPAALKDKWDPNGISIPGNP